MRRSVHEGDGMAVVWETSILPLLEEHHFGEGRDVAKEYSLSRILQGRRWSFSKRRRPRHCR